ncbi:MAG: Fic family protein [Gammaproteobacteria bacterium]|nr:Fic family protein [Gammaproteobacteria bacterium]
MNKLIEQMRPNRAKAIMLAQREVSIFVYDAVQLEGINFTLPEIQTLMQGVTVGGHPLSDQLIAVNQAKAWQYLFTSVKEQSFALTIPYVCQLHQIAAKEEALQWGAFREGGVTIAGTQYEPPPAAQLVSLFAQMKNEIEAIEDIYQQAISLFLQMARNQFFYDVNKRVGRFMMNGTLLDAGYPAINLPASRQLEFNQLMLDFYDSNDMTAMVGFMLSCLDPRAIKIMSE